MIPILLDRKLKQIKNDLQYLTGQGAQYDIDYINTMLEYLESVMGTEGIYTQYLKEVNPEDVIGKKHFKEISDNLYLFLTDTDDVMDDIVNKLNILLLKINNSMNVVKSTVEEANTKTKDITTKVIDNVSLKSIYDEEVKLINFNTNPMVNNVRITDSNIMTLNYSNYTIYNMNKLKLNNYIMNTKYEPLKITKENTFGEKDYNLPEGYWFGEFIKMNNNNITRGRIEDINTKTNRTDDNFNIQTITQDTTGKLTTEITGTLPPKVNEVYIVGNGNTKFTDGENVYTPKNNWLFTKLDGSNVKLTLYNIKPETEQFTRIRIQPKISYNIRDVEQLNVYESIIYKASAVVPDLLGINAAIKNKVGYNTTNNSRYRFIYTYEQMKVYNTNITGLKFISAKYDLLGEWQSSYVTTDKKIVGVELLASTSLPDDEHNYITYSISFDGDNWYQIRNKNAAETEANKNLPIRIELNTNSHRDDYKVLIDTINRFGVYVKVNMSTIDEEITPVLYDLKLRIKVEGQNE